VSSPLIYRGLTVGPPSTRSHPKGVQRTGYRIAPLYLPHTPSRTKQAAQADRFQRVFLPRVRHVAQAEVP